MGSTGASAGAGLPNCGLRIEKETGLDRVVALAGNPNVGKSTVFNSLTGLRQHTGNWPGKTVANAQGKYRHKGRSFILVDIPGTYSLTANSAEEEVARDFLCFGGADAVVVVADATCLERNLNLVMQATEITDNIVLCVNLMDEAEKKKISIDLEALRSRLGIPVVGTSARSGRGLAELMDAVWDLTEGLTKTEPVRVDYGAPIESAVSALEGEAERLLGGRVSARWASLKLLEGDENLLAAIREHTGCDLTEDEDLAALAVRARSELERAGIGPNELTDAVVTGIIGKCELIAREAVTFKKEGYSDTDRKIDRVLTSKLTGIPVMAALLFLIFWLTISGANIPSGLLSKGLFALEGPLGDLFVRFRAPGWLRSAAVDGVYRTLAWVVSVMLPPMAIFFPLFTLLEDLGYLPRVAFNLDSFFRKAGAHGKQSLTMCMGFGCNAAGVTGCRIIDSPRERLIATVTNVFVPCNGRFPTLAAVIAMFFAGAGGIFGSAAPTLILTAVVILGVVMTLLTSKLLSKTVLKGLPSSFNLELPPYRRPQIGRVIVRSVLDRTLFVLGRAAAVAAPAGLVIWILANVGAGQTSLLEHIAAFLDPLARFAGLDGYVLLAFILSFPANETVIPIIIMSYTASGKLTQFEGLSQLHALLDSRGWTHLTAVCVMIFCLMHWPCAATCVTIKKETRSLKWTLLSAALPTAAGFALCSVTAAAARLLRLA